MSRFIDITGNKYGRLTVIRIGDSLIRKDGKKENRWVCKCDCGNPNEILVLGYNLKNGNTKVTPSQSHMNKTLQSNNTSGFRGVWWNEKIHKWIAEIGAYGKKYYLGSFVNLDEDVAQRKIAEKKYFVEFNYTGGDDSYDKY